MAKKDKYISFVIGDLTDTQAANIMRDVTKSKNKHAPGSRGFGAISTKEGVGSILSGGWRKQIGDGD